MILRELVRSEPAGRRLARREVESRMRTRRATIALCLAELTANARNHLTSPAALLTAGLLGAAADRSPQPGHLKIMAVLHAVQTGLQILQSTTASDQQASLIASRRTASKTSSA